MRLNNLHGLFSRDPHNPSRGPDFRRFSVGIPVAVIPICLLAELKGIEANRAATQRRQVMIFSRTSILMFAATVFAALSAVSFVG